jgi:hypothetical protein
VAERAPKQGGEGLSLQTLVIAAAASGLAAVVTSYFWDKGTLISAAMTPVIVTVVSEMLKRPAQTVRRAARTARSPAPARERESLPLPHATGAGSPSEGPSRELPAPPEPSAAMSDIRVYRTETRRPRFGRIHWKIVLATAGIAFVIAIAALTLPELLFGSSVGGAGNTTFLGGGSQTHKSDNQKTTTGEQKTTTEPDKTVTEQKTTTVQTQTAPAQTTPTQTTPSTTPQQAAPSSTTPAPQQGTAPQQPPPG